MSAVDPIEYIERAVAFIDILGFKERIFSMQDDQVELKKVYDLLQEMKRAKRKASQFLDNKIEVSVFSDSIVLSAERQNAFELVWRSGWLQSQLLYLGFLCRGGIALGKVVHKDDILFGEGMIKAYHLESKVAVYPRIIIEDQIIEENRQDPLTMSIDTDADGCNFVAPFEFVLSENEILKLSGGNMPG